MDNKEIKDLRKLMQDLMRKLNKKELEIPDIAIVWNKIKNESN